MRAAGGAGDEFAEMSELGGGGGGRWWSGGYHEAEDVGGGGVGGGGARGRAGGMYYSPPGTSYTIVERPSSQHREARDRGPRGTYLGATPNNKKRPISPEQVLRMLSPGGGHHGGSSARLARRSPASSPASTTHYAAGGGGSGGGGPRSPGAGSYPVHELATRTVSMVRDPADGTHGFGICVKGGKDSGVGVYISRVEEGSVAERAGLRPGDSILEVNGTPFTGISHEEALKMLKSCRKLSMTVRSPSLAGGVERGGGWLVRQTCSWMDRQGRPVSPPLEYAPRVACPAPPPPPPPAHPRYPPPPPAASRSGSKDRSIRRVDLCIEPGQSLGLMIRGGVEYNLGIFITGVDKESVAERAGLQVGDQILEVNGQSFLAVTHDEAVGQLKYHKRMSLVVRDVGKVPHACTAWDSDGGGGGASTRWTALQVVEEKARCVLARAEFAALCCYTDEYAARRLQVDGYVAAVLALLNTPERYTLVAELREIIAPEDRARFDHLVYNRHEPLRAPPTRDPRDHDYRHARRKGEGRGVVGGGGILDGNHTLLMSSLHEISAPDYGAPEAAAFSEDEYRSPSEDSGLGLAAADRDRAHLHHRPRPASAASTIGGGGGWGPAPGHAASSDLALANDDGHAAAGQSWYAVRRAQHTSQGRRAHPDTPTSPTDTVNTSGYGSGSDEAEGCVGGGRRHSSPGESRAGSAVDLHSQDDYGDSTGYLGGLRSHLGGWTQRMKSWYWGRPLELAHKLSRSFDMKDEQSLLDGGDGLGGGMRRHQSMQRLARSELGEGTGGAGAGGGNVVVADLHGNLRVTVRKCKPILGIAIEGGANTKHPLPRIINIHENGAAYSAGGLEVGQLILQVDGQRVEGLQHQEVARLIAEAFARPDREDIEFLVVEAKKSNLEPKPTALIFLEA